MQLQLHIVPLYAITPAEGAIPEHPAFQSRHAVTGECTTGYSSGSLAGIEDQSEKLSIVGSRDARTFLDASHGYRSVVRIDAMHDNEIDSDVVSSGTASRIATSPISTPG